MMMMSKKLFTLFFLLLIISQTNAQEPNVALINEIEGQVAANPDDPNRLSKKGDIYSDIARYPQNYTEEYKESVYIAYEAYKKAVEVSNNQSNSAREGIKILHPIAINVGATAYTLGKTEEALRAFELAQEIDPKDTLPFMYSIEILKVIEEEPESLKDKAKKKDDSPRFTVTDKEKYVKNMEGLLIMPFGSKLSYWEEYVTFYASPGENQDYDKALEWAEKGLEEFPKYARFEEVQIIIYIIQENDIKVEQNISEQKRKVEADPNYEAYYNFGVANETVARAYEEVAKDDTWGVSDPYEQQLKMDIALSYLQDALTSYEKSLEMKADEPNTIYNIASVHYNLGVRVNDSINVKVEAQDFKKKELLKMRERRNDHFLNALPYFENIRENYQDVIRAREKKYLIEQLEAMRTIYRELDRREDQEKYKSVLEELNQVYQDEQIINKKDYQKELMELQKELATFKEKEEI